MALRQVVSSYLRVMRASSRQISVEGQSIAAGLKRLGLFLTQRLTGGKWTNSFDGDVDKDDNNAISSAYYNASNFKKSHGKVLLVEEIRHSESLGGYLFKINCYNVTTNDGFMVTVSYQFCAQIPDPKLVPQVRQMAEVLIRLHVANVAASEIVPSNLHQPVLAGIKLVARHLGVTCNDSYGSNLEVQNVQPSYLTSKIYKTKPTC